MFSQESEGTNLSAEVPPFVPRRTWNDEQALQSSNNLPRYVTTCYPFVQEQQDRRLLNSSPSVQSLSLNPTPHWPAPIYPPAIVDPNVLASRSLPNNLSLLRFSGAQGNIADNAQGNAVISASLQLSHKASVQKHHGNSNKGHTSKSDSKQKKKVTKKNVGVQKEVCGSDSDNDPAPTMVDSCQQTDFPSSIAFKSLTDKPSPLKKTRSRRSATARSSANDSPDSSSDQADADVDSDSGYYSPKRRMGQKKGGAGGFTNADQPGAPLHPLMFLPGNIPPSLLFSPTSSAQLHANLLSPHLRSTAPNPGGIVGFPAPDAPLMLSPAPNSVLNHAPITSRPPPGFPLPPSMLKPHAAMQLRDGWVWNGAQCPPNVAPPPPYRVQRPYSKSNNSNPGIPNRKQHLRQNPAPSNQEVQRKSRKPETGSIRANTARPQNDGSKENNMANSATSSNKAIFLQDANEFPGLGDGPMPRNLAMNNKLSYSQALAQTAITRHQVKSEPSNPQLAQPAEDNYEQTQKSRKRWKKAERASKAADEEYAEISKEQENIKNALKKTASHRNRKQQPMLDLGEIFSKLEAKSSSKIASGGAKSKKTTHSAGGVKHPPRPKSKLLPGANPLDATMPSVRRGKERETPKVKKPSALKKVILKEREEKKEQRLQQLSTMTCPDHDVPPYPSAILNPAPKQASSSEEATEPNLSQLTIDDVPVDVPQIHSRRYREYCCQVLDKKIDETCTLVLQRLVFFQERMYQKDPVKAKMRRRLVMGIREVTKHLKLKKLKCVIISPNLEKIQSKGGLDDALQQILDMCEEQNVTYIFALGRKAMGRAVSKLVPVSIVGIFDYSGVDEQYKKLVSLVGDAQNEYKEMVSIYQQEVVKANTTSAPVPSSTAKRFAHMTHSRNPSATSCVSFASFISEPISELEDSNWRVLMDAGEEPPLSPTAEDEGSLSDEDVGETSKDEESEQQSRKDSQSTVVECKTIQEHPVETLIEEAPLQPPLENLSSEDTSDYEDATSQTSKHLEEKRPASTDVKAEVAAKAPHQSSLLQDDPPSETSYSSGSPTLIGALEEPSSADRIHMWLEDSQCSISNGKAEEDAQQCTSGEEGTAEPS